MAAIYSIGQAHHFGWEKRVFEPLSPAVPLLLDIYICAVYITGWHLNLLFILHSKTFDF